jgi:hypothetical protein
LVIDPDAPLAFSITFQGLEPVVRRDPQLLHPDHPVDDCQLSDRNGFDVREPGNPLAIEERLGISTVEGLDGHVLMLLINDTIVKQYFHSVMRS